MKGTNEFDGIEGLDQLLEAHDKFRELTRIAEPVQTAVQRLKQLQIVGKQDYSLNYWMQRILQILMAPFKPLRILLLPLKGIMITSH